MREKLLPIFEKSIFVLEIIVSIMLAIGITIGIFDMMNFFPELLTTSTDQTYVMFQSFFAFALILIVGIELILMILYHSTRAMLELILFVIARKMLIYSDTMVDLVYGTIAIAIVFFIKKFLISNSNVNIIRSNTFHDDDRSIIEEVRALFGEKEKLKDQTLVETLNEMTHKVGLQVEKGQVFELEDQNVIVTSLTEDGAINDVVIQNKNADDWRSL